MQNAKQYNLRKILKQCNDTELIEIRYKYTKLKFGIIVYLTNINQETDHSFCNIYNPKLHLLILCIFFGENKIIVFLSTLHKKPVIVYTTELNMVF
jgi:hypothetical protein